MIRDQSDNVPTTKSVLDKLTEKGNHSYARFYWCDQLIFTPDLGDINENVAGF